MSSSPLFPYHPHNPTRACPAGRNVDEESPSKGRVAKAPRTAGGAAQLAPPTAGSAYLSVCHQVGCGVTFCWQAPFAGS